MTTSSLSSVTRAQWAQAYRAARVDLHNDREGSDLLYFLSEFRDVVPYELGAVASDATRHARSPYYAWENAWAECRWDCITDPIPF